MKHSVDFRETPSEEAPERGATTTLEDSRESAERIRCYVFFFPSTTARRTLRASGVYGGGGQRPDRQPRFFWPLFPLGKSTIDDHGYHERSFPLISNSFIIF